MKKQKVSFAGKHIYITIPSRFGSSIGKNHPMFNDTFYTKEELDLKEGDILRCDGLPFLTRPSIKRKGIIRAMANQLKYTPHQLNNGMWVLRVNK